MTHHQEQKNTTIKNVPKKRPVRKRIVSDIEVLNKTIVRFICNPDDNEEKQAWALERMRVYCEDRGARTTLRYYANNRPKLYLYAQVFGREDIIRTIHKEAYRLGLKYSTEPDFRSLDELFPDILEQEHEQQLDGKEEKEEHGV